MTHPDSPEFLAILERVPRWHMLTPGVDVWREGDLHKGELYKIDNDTPTKKYPWYTRECLFPNTEANSKVAYQLISLAYAQDLIKKSIEDLKKGLTQNE